MSQRWAVSPVDSFRLTFACLHGQGCEREFLISMMGSANAAQQARNNPPPNSNGWVNGYCPDHAEQATQATTHGK